MTGCLSSTARAVGISEAILAAESSAIPRIGWFVKCGAAVGLSENHTVLLIWLMLLGSSLLLIAGMFSRTAAVVAWLLHLAAVKSTSVFSYGVDGFTTIGLFYLALSPLPDPYALDWRWRKLRPRYVDLSGFFRRALQLHLCFIYFFSGLAKILGNGWWNGDNLWRAVTRPPFDVLDPGFVAKAKVLLPAAGIAICLLELGYMVLIWPKQTRSFWLVGIIGMHIGIGVFMGMPLFAFVMILLNVAAFGPPLLCHVPPIWRKPSRRIRLPAVGIGRASFYARRRRFILRRFPSQRTKKCPRNQSRI
jgi:hypothetical protein